MKPSKNGVKIGKDWRAYRRTQDGLHTYTSVVYKTGQIEDGRDLISIQANHHWSTKHSEIVGPSLDCSDDKRYSMILSL